MENILGNIFTIVGCLVLVALAIGTAGFGIAALGERWGQFQKYQEAWCSIVELRNVYEYCSSRYPIIQDVYLQCKNPVATSEFRESLKKKYPAASGATETGVK